MTLVSSQIKTIREAGSRKQKQALLREFMNAPHSELFRLVVKYGMDPTIMFNVGKRSLSPKVDGRSAMRSVLSVDDFNTLRNLANRTINRTQGAAWASARISELIPAEGNLLIAILDKDLSWGLGAGSVNEVVPGFITEFNCMLAAPFNPSAINYPCRVEPKYDGMRVLALVGITGVSFFSRTGKPITSLPDSLAHECQKLARLVLRDQLVVFDGEVMGNSFKETMERARRKGEVFDTARFHIFDWLPRAEFDKISKAASSRTYSERRAVLEKAHDADSWKHIALPDSYIASSQDEVTHFYNSFRDMGLEGAIVKAIGGHYVGKRSSLWIKMKAEETEDLEIVDFEEGDGKYAGMLGALVVSRNGVLVRVGSGLSDSDRQIIWQNRNLYLHKLAEVQHQEVTSDGSLRHPRFVRLRMDKSEW